MIFNALLANYLTPFGETSIDNVIMSNETFIPQKENKTLHIIVLTETDGIFKRISKLVDMPIDQYMKSLNVMSD